MANSGLNGSYPLTAEKIDEVVLGSHPGAYALGYDSKDGKSFHIQYVGRSDYNLNSRLHNYVDSKYKRFKFMQYTTMKEAFEKECRLYHDFDPVDNSVHPDKPSGTNYKCPVRGCS